MRACGGGSRAGSCRRIPRRSPPLAGPEASRGNDADPPASGEGEFYRATFDHRFKMRFRIRGAANVTRARWLASCSSTRVAAARRCLRWLKKHSTWSRKRWRRRRGGTHPDWPIMSIRLSPRGSAPTARSCFFFFVLAFRECQTRTPSRHARRRRGRCVPPLPAREPA